MAELQAVPGALAFLRAAFLEESGGALVSKYAGLDPLFTRAGYEAYVDDLLARMTNPYLLRRQGRWGTAGKLLDDFLAKQFTDQELSIVQSVLERGQATGELGPTDTRLAAIAVTGTLRSLDQPWIFHELPLDLEQRVDDVIHLFLHGLKTRKDAA